MSLGLGSGRRLALCSARGEMNDADLSFWRRLKNALGGLGWDLVVLSSAKPPAACGFAFVVHPRSVDWVPEIEEGSLLDWITLPLSAEERSDCLRWADELYPLVRDEDRKSRRELSLDFFNGFYELVFRCLNPSLCIIWNGSHPHERMLLGVARRHACEVSFIERGPVPGTLHFDRSGCLGGSSVARASGWTWESDEDRVFWTKVFGRVASRQVEIGQTWWNQPQSLDLQFLRQRLDIDEGKIVALFAGQVDNDVQRFQYGREWGSGVDAFKAFQKSIPDRDKVFVLGKHHPKDIVPAEVYRAEFDGPGVWLDEVPLDQCFEISDCVASVNSTVTYEALQRGVPVLVMGRMLLTGKSIAWEIAESEDEELKRSKIREWLGGKGGVVRRKRWADFCAYLLSTQLYAYDQKWESQGVRGLDALALRIVEASGKGCFDKPMVDLAPLLAVPMRVKTVQLPKERLRLSLSVLRERALIVTECPFWRNSRGDEVRIYSLVKRLLAHSVEVTVVCFVDVLMADIEVLKEQFPGVRCVFFSRFYSNVIDLFVLDKSEYRYYRDIDLEKDVSNSENIIKEFNEFNRSRSLGGSRTIQQCSSPRNRVIVEEVVRELKPKLVILEMITTAYLAPHIKECCPRCVVLYDSHDVVSRRASSFAQAGFEHWVAVSTSDEAMLLGKCDYVLAIQKENKRVFSEMVEGSRVCLVPYAPVALPPVSGTDPTRGRDLLFVGSNAKPNVEAIRFLVSEVLPAVAKRIGFYPRLTIAGGVCEMVAEICEGRGGVDLFGAYDVSAQPWSLAGVFVSPIAFGDGLNIKNVEALLQGKALLTSRLGSEGLEDGIGQAFLVCEGLDGWVDAISSVCLNDDFRIKLGRRARDYAASRFDPDRVYRDFDLLVESALGLDVGKSGP